MLVEDAAAVEAVVAEVPILPRLSAVGRATSERKVGLESDWPSEMFAKDSEGGGRQMCVV